MNKIPVLVFLLILACFFYPKAQRLSWPVFLERDWLVCKFLAAPWLRVDLQEFMLSQQGAMATLGQQKPCWARIEIKSRASQHPCASPGQVPPVASIWVTLHHQTWAYLCLGLHVPLWIGLFPDPLKDTWDHMPGSASLWTPLPTCALAPQHLSWNINEHSPLPQPQTALWVLSCEPTHEGILIKETWNALHIQINARHPVPLMADISPPWDHRKTPETEQNRCVLAWSPPEAWNKVKNGTSDKVFVVIPSSGYTKENTFLPPASSKQLPPSI